MTWNEAMARALRFSTLRKVKYRVFAGRYRDRWVYYIAIAGSLPAVSCRTYQSTSAAGRR